MSTGLRIKISKGRNLEFDSEEVNSSHTEKQNDVALNKFTRFVLPRGRSSDGVLVFRGFPKDGAACHEGRDRLLPIAPENSRWDQKFHHRGRLTMPLGQESVFAAPISFQCPTSLDIQHKRRFGFVSTVLMSFFRV